MSRSHVSDSKALDPFAVPADFLNAKARGLCKTARAQHDKKQPRKRPQTHLPVEQLRAMLRQLLPEALAAVGDCGSMEEELHAPKGGTIWNIRADVPPIIAHFAFVALALIEAEIEAETR